MGGVVGTCSSVGWNFVRSLAVLHSGCTLSFPDGGVRGLPFLHGLYSCPTGEKEAFHFEQLVNFCSGQRNSLYQPLLAWSQVRRGVCVWNGFPKGARHRLVFRSPALNLSSCPCPPFALPSCPSWCGWDPIPLSRVPLSSESLLESSGKDVRASEFLSVWL